MTGQEACPTSKVNSIGTSLRTRDLLRMVFPMRGKRPSKST